MQDIKPSTKNEDRLFKEIQRAIGAYDNGIIGTQTMSDIAIKLNAKGFPYTLKMYGYPVIIGNDLIAFKGESGTNKYQNSMVGGFTYPSGKEPCSILVNNNVIVCGIACHAFLNKPETVIYKSKREGIGAKKIMYAKELPDDVIWAVGGMGLGNMYNPDEEGFSGKYADVLRKTNHNVLGVKNGKVYGVYYRNMTGQQIQDHVTQKMKFDYAILGDGGHLASINGTETFAQINTQTRQGYILQFI